MACKNCLSRFLRDETGAAAIEYAVMTFIAVAVIVVVGQVGERVLEMFTAVQGRLRSMIAAALLARS